MATIVLTGGGTGGHVVPNLALIPRFVADGWQVHYIGSKEGMERGMVEGVEGVTYHAISAGKLRRYASIRNLSDPFRVMAGLGQAWSLIGRLKPNVIFSKGGFVSVPVVAAGWLRNVPVVVHESDMTPGLANRMAIPLAKRLCTTFPDTAQAAGSKAVHTGPPIRPELFAGDRTRGLLATGLDGRRPVMLVMGGSLGARAINQAVDDALPRLLPAFQVLHIRGKGNLSAALQHTAGYRQYEYVSDGLADMLAAADIIVSRAGATAIWEFAALKKPMLLIPLPLSASRGDQIKNADYFRRMGWARVLPQEELTPDTLAAAVEDLWQHRRAAVAAMAAVPVDGLDRLEREIRAAARPGVACQNKAAHL